MLHADPDDPFLWYILALEYAKSGNTIRTDEVFDKLLNRFPEYLPTYYQAANFFRENGAIEKARSAFIEGIRLAEITGETKTEQELRNSYQNFLIDIDEL
ncbi:MAG: hypothetical protein KFF73_08175 [Cyclobacteriaceae bacterium]|nr:hypothetical protein [Cyclobacteriaceae bacterium]